MMLNFFQRLCNLHHNRVICLSQLFNHVKVVQILDKLESDVTFKARFLQFLKGNKK